MFAYDGTLLAVPWPPSSVLGEAFRGLLLAALRRAERLSESFFDSLLAWRTPAAELGDASQELLRSESIAG